MLALSGSLLSLTGWIGERVDVTFRDTLTMAIDDRRSWCSKYSSECNIQSKETGDAYQDPIHDRWDAAMQMSPVNRRNTFLDTQKM